MFRERERGGGEREKDGNRECWEYVCKFINIYL